MTRRTAAGNNFFLLSFLSFWYSYMSIYLYIPIATPNDVNFLTLFCGGLFLLATQKKTIENYNRLFYRENKKLCSVFLHGTESRGACEGVVFAVHQEPMESPLYPTYQA